MSRPKLALCIPAYRAEQHLPRLLASAQQQDPQFDEIIVCVDASPDRSAEVAKNWGVTVLVNERNMGCSASKNRTLSAATSDWVHFHDCDDILLPGFTAEAHRWMGLDDPSEVVIMGFEYRDFQSNELLATGLVDDKALASDPIGFSIRQKLPNFGIYQRVPLTRVGGFDCDPNVLHNEDVAFHTKLALAGLRFRASSLVTSVNWRHRGSMSGANPVRCLLAHHAVMIKVAQRAERKHFQAIAQNLWCAAAGLAAHREWEMVDRVLKDAWRLLPAVPRGQSNQFGLVCRLVGPRVAFRTREWAIRLLKPRLRRARV